MIIIVLISLSIFIQLTGLWILFRKLHILEKFIHKPNTVNNKNNPYNSVQWKDELKRTVELQCMEVRNAVQKQTVDIHKREIELSPKELSISENQLNKIYSFEQLMILNNFWEAYHTYIHKYWLTKNGEIKGVFQGTKVDPSSEISLLIGQSKLLTTQMNHWLKKIMEN
ncbi:MULTISPECIES: hypothetical protein [Bacillaceae]|uniref:Uncharacterized protein n=1 Tax=Evansella alkalicola TaxID=745819 RepID=A0ABS6JZK3_9BACI|nr:MULTISPECIES: hypothetical protein [Bacillaceae]MBU9724013.1 hypothetical protein [Bacillus alkalicola]